MLKRAVKFQFGAILKKPFFRAPLPASGGSRPRSPSYRCWSPAARFRRYLGQVKESSSHLSRARLPHVCIKEWPEQYVETSSFLGAAATVAVVAADGRTRTGQPNMNRDLMVRVEKSAEE